MYHVIILIITIVLVLIFGTLNEIMWDLDRKITKWSEERAERRFWKKLMR